MLQPLDRTSKTYLEYRLEERSAFAPLSPRCHPLANSKKMGWIRGYASAKIATRAEDISEQHTKTKGGVEHVEYVNNVPEDWASSQQPKKPIANNKYPLQPTTVADEDLPFIHPEVVSSKRRPGALSGQTGHSEDREYWIVVDDIVYDCSSFIEEHPGGEQVILSFVGENCSWQFWRFHGKNEMDQYGQELRIGRTKGIENRFEEPVRFVGLSKFGDDDW